MDFFLSSTDFVKWTSKYSRLHLSRRRLSRYSLKSIMISWNIPISSNFHVKLEPLSRCRLSRHDGQVDLLILLYVSSCYKGMSG